MDVRTLKALQGSIKKWEKIWNGRGVDKGPQNCPLCRMFLNRQCEECPVYETTHKVSCENTPYDLWSQHQPCKDPDKGVYRRNQEFCVHCPTCKRLAKQELDFLKSLLPKGTARKVKEGR